MTPEKTKYMLEYYRKNKNNIIQYHHKYYTENKQIVKDKAIAVRAAHRLSLLNILGNKCVRCGFSDMRALQIDHINSDGKKDRIRFANPDRAYFYYLHHLDEIEHNLQLLCANCNWIKRWEKNENPYHSS